MRIKRRGMCMALACVMFATVGPVGDYRGKVKAEVNESTGVYVNGSKLEGNVLTLDGYQGECIDISNDSESIADLEIVIKGENTLSGIRPDEDSSIYGLSVKRTNIKLSGDGVLTVKGDVDVLDGNVEIDGPKVVVEDSVNGVRLVAEKPEEVEPETETETESEVETETESETETETESQVETESEVETETELETESQIETESETEESTEESSEELSSEMQTENMDANSEESFNEEFDSEEESESEEETEPQKDIEYADCTFTMTSGSLAVYMMPTSVSSKSGIKKYVYNHGIYAKKVFMNDGTIKVEYKDRDDNLKNSNNEMYISSETAEGKAEGIIIFSDYDLVQKDTRFVIITPNVYNHNVKLHSEYEKVVYNTERIVYLNSSNINDLKVKLSEDKYTYDGKSKNPEVTIKGLLKDIDYKVEYSNNVDPGKATVKVEGINMFSGSVTLNFNIEKKAEVQKTVVKPVVKPTTTVKTKTVKKTVKKKKAVVYKAGFKFKDATFVYEVKRAGSSKKTGEVRIVGLRKKNTKSAVIKSRVKYKKVIFNITEIKENAFNKLKKLEKIKIGNNIKLIGKDAFAGLKEEFIIKIPKKNKKKIKKLLKKSGYEGLIK